MHYINRALAYGLIFTSFGASLSAADDYQPYVLTEGQQAVIHAAIGKELKDPYSAKFEDFQASIDHMSMVHVCGYVNAKNSFGAYSGRVPFYAAVIPYDPPKEPIVMMKVFSESDAVSAQTLNICRANRVPLD
ncbi:hypothetical protein [Celeribacter baekdonensis]|uniref:hypothetical protein n=1 Tax=Celeribacter baekdonensis TaxID=875171 RepID=UPI0030D961D7|tara:strand:+ start:34517 stop:34915 length:399 start_codon:yes stop_codon:yes gene_type:complete